MITPLIEWYDKDIVKDSNPCDNNSPNQKHIKKLNIYKQ